MMDNAFWLQRWQDNQIGFHQARVLPLLEQHWPTLQLPAGSRVCVPLAGKSLDMLWLAAQGHGVLGVELSPLAVQQFFADNGLTPEGHQSRYGRHHVAGAIELICGDIFGLDAAAVADCAGVYDRAALIALPKAMRRRYVETFYAGLPALCQGLLITLEYPQAQRDGPPFSVEQAEVERLFGPCCPPQLLERRDILDREPGFASAGVDALTTAVYHLPARGS